MSIDNNIPMSDKVYKPQIDPRITLVLTPRESVVYMHLKSKREGWMFYNETIARAMGCCSRTIRRATKSLVAKGYVTRSRVRLSMGSLAGYTYKVFEPNERRELIGKIRKAAIKSYANSKKRILKKIEELQRYALKNPLIVHDFTSGHFWPPSKIKEEVLFNISNHHANIPKIPILPDKNNSDWIDNMPTWSEIVKNRSLLR